MQDFVLLLLLASGAVRIAEAYRIGAPQLDDPFGSLMPPTNGNPNIQIPMQQAGGNANDPGVQVVIEEERLLNSEAVLNEQVELNQEERMEVQCVGMEHLREVTEYLNEQDEVESELKNVRNFVPTEAEHQCLPLHKRNKYMPSKFFPDHSSYVNLPAFPERLGELVIEEVKHTDKTLGSNQHVVLEVQGCTSCENDITRTVEWGGLLAVDETGHYRKMYRGPSNTDNFGDWHFRRGDRTEIVASKSKGGNPPVFAFEATPVASQKYVKRFQYKYSSYKFDKVIEPEAHKLAEEAVQQHKTVDANFVATHKANETHLMQELREQTKHMPFNHKLEQLHLNVYVCSESGKGLECPPTPEETLIVHDGALVVESSRTTLLDQLGQSGACSYGPCAQSRGMNLKGVTWPYTMCSDCRNRACKASRTEPNKALLSLSQSAPENWFNCMVERAYTGNGYTDMLLQAETDTDPKARPGHGMLYHATSSPGHVSGHINWHTTVPKAGECTPFLEDVAYVGIGVDECDKCGNQGVDVDIGVLLLKCGYNQASDKLGSPSGCSYYHHLNFAQQRAKNNYYGISEDNRGGEGEGDDEWAFLNLAKLKTEGVTHIIILANIFGCENGRSPSGGINWQDLEGAFVRVVGSSGNSKEFPMAETIGYIDLDEMRGPAKQGAGVMMLYLSDDAKLAKQEEIVRTDDAAGSGRVWKMMATKKPIPGRTLSKSARDLSQFGLSVINNHERTLGEQAQSMDLINTMSTGQEVPGLTDELGPVVMEGLDVAQNQHMSGETSAERSAKKMDDHTFWQSFAATLPEGPPGSDAMCIR